MSRAIAHVSGGRSWALGPDYLCRNFSAGQTRIVLSAGKHTIASRTRGLCAGAASRAAGLCKERRGALVSAQVDIVQTEVPG
jgi:hypothetical protein